MRESILRGPWGPIFFPLVFLGTVLISHAASPDPVPTPTSEPDSKSIRRSSDMKGSILRTFKEEKMISLGDELVLRVDPSKMVKGDLLSAYRVVPAEDRREKKNPYVEIAGIIRINSVSDTLVTGRIIRLVDVLRVGDRLDYSLSPEIQENRYVPFLKEVADLYLDEEGDRPASVLFLDVTDPEGDITHLSESVYLDMRDLICGRPQFECISRETYLPHLDRYGVSTSRSVDRFVEQTIRETLKPDVWIRAESGFDPQGRLSVRMSAVDPLRIRDRVEHEVIVDPAEVYDSVADPGGVLVRFVPVPRAKIHVVHQEPREISGKKVRFFHWELLEDRISPEVWRVISAGKDPAVPGDFFLELDGKRYSSDKERVLFSDLVQVGSHELKAGFYPMIQTKQGLERAGGPIQNTFSLNPSDGEEWRVEVSNLILGDKAYVLVDTRVVK